jgi:hypothetical protein
MPDDTEDSYQLKEAARATRDVADAVIQVTDKDK